MRQYFIFNTIQQQRITVNNHKQTNRIKHLTLNVHVLLIFEEDVSEKHYTN